MRLVDWSLDHLGIIAGIALLLLAAWRTPASRRFRPTSFTVWGTLLFSACALGGAFLFDWPETGWEKGEFASWLAFGALGGFVFTGVLLLLTGRWSAIASLVLMTLLALGVGGSLLQGVQKAFGDLLRNLWNVEFASPSYLVLLLLLPLAWWMCRGSLAGLGPVRAKLALGLRLGVLTLVVLTLAEPRVRQSNDHLTVLYVVDRSLSVPQEIDPQSAESAGGSRDRRLERVQAFINEAVSRRGYDHRNDRSGVIFFGKRPRLVMPPSPVDRMIVNDQIAGPLDPNYTDIAAALKLALASFPEGSGKRIVLASDGNENLGNALEQANLAKTNGVTIDTIPLAVGYRNESEVLVQSVEAPPQTAKGSRLPIRVVIRNASPDRLVTGTLELLQAREGKERPITIQDGIDVVDGAKSPAIVRLRPGLNTFTFRDKAEGKEDELSFTYRAVFTPVENSDARGKDRVAGLPGDRIQNNRGSTHVIAKGSRRVLFLEEKGGEDGNFDQQFLIDQLRVAKFTVIPMSVSRLPQNKGDLAVFLTNYDCVIIANVPAELLSPTQQEVLRANTYDQGCGLIFVGGPESYGAGGYQKTAIEQALPVDCDIKAIKAAGKGGLVLIMHASEMADGNTWQKRIAKLAVERLAPVDMVGVLFYDLSSKWHIPFQQVGVDRGRFFAQIDRMQPGDMPDFDPFLRNAYDTLSDPVHGLTTKHVIVISDGDPMLSGIGRTALTKMAEAGITCTTVGVATHGASEDTKMKQMSEMAFKGGKFYNVRDPSQLPAIYIKESRRVSQSYVHNTKFKPKLVFRNEAIDKLDDDLPELFGFVRTTLKNSPLAEMLIEGPKTFDMRFPILATWQYGLGRSVAVTTDARTIPKRVEGWDRQWAGSDIYLKFWEQLVTWAIRGLETDRLAVTTEYRDGKVRVVVEARDEQGKPLTDLRLDGAVTSPSGAADGAKPIAIVLQQKSGGRYEAEFKSEEAGTYLVNVRARKMVPLFEDGKPRYKGRFRDGLPMTVTEKDGQLVLEDGTVVLRKGNGFAYADDGKPVEIQDQVEKVVDSRRTGVSISYSPEFADVETNASLLKDLSRITNGNVYDEEPESLKALARSGEVYRPAPQGFRAPLPFWYWLVFFAGIGLLFDVANRRISIEPGEYRQHFESLWTRLRTSGSAEMGRTDDAMSRLREAKRVAGESIEQKRAGRRFEAVPGGTTVAPPTADESAARGPAPDLPVPPPPSRTPKPTEPEDYFSKLRKAKKRAGNERPDENPPPTN